MLITFSCEAHPDIILFAEVGLQLLTLMGYQDVLKASISPQEAATACERLKKSLASVKEAQISSSGKTAWQEEDEPRVSLSHRALPLMELLDFAAKEEHIVNWQAS